MTVESPTLTDTTELQARAEPTLRTVRAGSFSTAYVEAGAPAAPTVVLLHDGAYGSTAWLCWEPIIRDLARDHHVIAPDLLGFGGTDKAVFLDRSPYAFRIDHVSDFCRALGITDAVFIGASFGGSLLLRGLAQAPGALPASRGVSVSGTGGPFRLASGIAALAEYDVTEEGARALTALVVNDVSGLDAHVKARYENSLAPGHWEVANAPRLHNPAASGATRVDTFLDDLASVTVPMLFVAGTADVLLEEGWAEKLSAATPGSTVVVRDFAHEPNIDRPDELLVILREFIG